MEEKKIERDEADHVAAFDQLKHVTQEKEQQRMTREQDSEERFY